MTVLVDTSVWAAALRKNGDATVAAELAGLVTAGNVRVHPWVLGELVLGGLSRAARTSLEAQPAAPVLAAGEQLAFVDTHGLAGAGIGWVDTQLLACGAARGWPLWTLDLALVEAARRVGLSTRRTS